MLTLNRSMGFKSVILTWCVSKLMGGSMSLVLQYKPNENIEKLILFKE